MQPARADYPALYISEFIKRKINVRDKTAELEPAESLGQLIAAFVFMVEKDDHQKSILLI